MSKNEEFVISTVDNLNTANCPFSWVKVEFVMVILESKDVRMNKDSGAKEMLLTSVSNTFSSLPINSMPYLVTLKS